MKRVSHELASMKAPWTLLPKALIDCLSLSIVEALSVRESSVCVHLSLESASVLRLCGSAHDADLVNFEEGLEEISATNFKKSFDLVVARIFPETFVIEVCLVELHGGSLVAHHEFLEVKEAQVP
jgi:hypothetical protein